MTIRQWDRREELRGELSDLVMEVALLGRTAEGQNTPEFRRLAQQMAEKTAELEALNALCSDPNELRELKYRRFVRENRDIFWVLQIFFFIALFVFLSFLSVELHSGGGMVGLIIFVILCSCACIAWVTYILCRYKPE